MAGNIRHQDPSPVAIKTTQSDQIGSRTDIPGHSARPGGDRSGQYSPPILRRRRREFPLRQITAVAYPPLVYCTTPGVQSNGISTRNISSYWQEETTRSSQTLETHLVIIDEYCPSSTPVLALVLFVRTNCRWLPCAASKHPDQAQRSRMPTRNLFPFPEELLFPSIWERQKNTWYSSSRNVSLRR